MKKIKDSASLELRSTLKSAETNFCHVATNSALNLDTQHSSTANAAVSLPAAVCTFTVNSLRSSERQKILQLLVVLLRKGSRLQQV